jgi:hypothetical protein
MARKLSLAEVTAVGIGGMIGGGIFAVLGLAIAQAGRARNRVRGARTPPAPLGANAIGDVPLAVSHNDTLAILVQHLVTRPARRCAVKIGHLTS